MAPHMQVITDNLDLWTSALLTKSTAGRGSNGRVEAYGIKKLRELILELAVRGKLVPQDPNDEPASVLLKKNSAERTQLVKEGKARKKDILPTISAQEEPYVLPNGWEWARLGQIIDISSGDGLTATNMISSGEIPVYGGNGVNGYHDKANITKQTLVIGRVGYYCGSIHITPALAWVTDNAFVTTFSEENIYFDFLYWLLKGTNLKENENATAQPVISGRKLYPIVVGLPPKEEQHRIVAKVDELMALCDQLEKQQTTSIEAHQTLVETLLGTLTNVESQEEFAKAWTRIANHFDTLFTTEQSIDQLKQTILQLAVMGKLVPQDPNDEPASRLLVKIAKEKERLVKNGVLNKEKLLPEISIEEIPYKLPVGWEWERIGRASLTTDYGLSEKTFNDPTGVPVLKMGDIVNGEVLLSGQKTVPAHVDGLPELFLEEGDLLYNRTNSAELVGKTGVYEGGSGAYTFASYLIRIRLAKDFIVPRYLNICMNSPNFRKSEIEPQLKQQCGQANVNGTIMRNMRVPIPSTAEQHRIVAKVGELMALCDTLKARLAHVQATQLHLADTIVEQAVA